MSESDKRYYARIERHDAKRKIILAKATNRGKIAKDWFDAGNLLTSKTKKEFNALMKKADKDFDDGHN